MSNHTPRHRCLTVYVVAVLILNTGPAVRVWTAGSVPVFELWKKLKSNRWCHSKRVEKWHKKTSSTIQNVEVNYMTNTSAILSRKVFI